MAKAALTQLGECPLWVKSRRLATTYRMSAFGGKADVNHCVGECPLIAISGHEIRKVVAKRLLFKLESVAMRRPIHIAGLHKFVRSHGEGGTYPVR